MGLKQIAINAARLGMNLAGDAKTVLVFSRVVPGEYVSATDTTQAAPTVLPPVSGLLYNARQSQDQERAPKVSEFCCLVEDFPAPVDTNWTAQVRNPDGSDGEKFVVKACEADPTRAAVWLITLAK